MIAPWPAITVVAGLLGFLELIDETIRLAPNLRVEDQQAVVARDGPLTGSFQTISHLRPSCAKAGQRRIIAH
jgi:hypothetical protein